MTNPEHHKEIWRIETEQWLLLEYENQQVSLCHKEDDQYFYLFGFLGVSHVKLEQTEEEVLDTILTLTTDCLDNYNVSVSASSLWDIINQEAPSIWKFLKQEVRDEDSNPETLEMFNKIENFIGEGKNLH
ncbi:MAG: hypothetical protein KME08_13755 [Aphanothece sp. CMT-3BRIN-NPC111]|jgi:hypothetical protein|nr:hypothetical protein [Aphanothece sp. CMT-3BRIN-NPC111]